MKKNQTAGIYIMIILVLALFIASVFTSKNTTVKDLSYSQFINKVTNGQIQSVSIDRINLMATPKEEFEEFDENTTTKKSLKIEYSVNIPYNYTGLIDKLETNKVDITIKTPDKSFQMLNSFGFLFLGLLLIIGLMLMFRSVQGGGSQAMSFGKSKAKLILDNKVKTTFKDVAGIDEAKQELEEIVDFLKNGEKYLALGAKIPKGVLVVGAPGTGKTLMAKAVAGEAGVPFFNISGSDFVEMFVGVGASRVRDLFEQAKKHSPCIIFIDEIDAVGRQRGAGLGGGHDEREQTLNQLLVEMDGFDGTQGIIIIAATNRPDILDNALLRPGRFDRQVTIDKPDIQGREQILEVHIKGKPLASNVNILTIAKRTPGFTGADLSNLLNEAALLAARDKKEEIGIDDIDEAIDKVYAGLKKKNKVISEKDKEITAYHEVGHALLAYFLEFADKLHKVSIVPRGMALGLTWTLPDEDNVHMTRSKLRDEVSMLLGGRVAEELVFNEMTTGASNDIERATSIARKMVTAWGMSDKMGTVTFGKKTEHVFLGKEMGGDKDYSEEIASTIDNEIKAIIKEQYNHAKDVLGNNRELMDRIVHVLLEKETLDSNEFIEIIENHKNQNQEGS